MFIHIKHIEGYPDNFRTIVIDPVMFKSFLWELPFWCGVVIWTLLPVTLTPWFTLAGIPFDSKGLLVVIMAGFYSVLFLDGLFKEKKAFLQHNFRKIKHGAWAYRLPLFTAFIFMYLALSVTWSGMSKRDIFAMLMMLVESGSAFLLGFMMITKREQAIIEEFLWRLTIILAGIGLIYSTESFFSLGLRTETFISGEYDIQRVKGPLFGASTGFFILLPALGFGIQQVSNRNRKTLVVTIISFALILTILGTGSRAGVYLLGLYVLFVVLSVRGKQLLLASGVFIVVGILAAVFVFSNVKVDRLRSVKSEGRTSTHVIAWQIIKHRSVAESIFGSGYGSYWAWYLQEVDYKDVAFASWKYEFRGVHTEYGKMLYHPHSVFLVFAVELGAVGVLYFASLWWALVNLLLRNLCGAPFGIFSLSVIASGFGLFFDLFYFRDAPLNLFWWVYFFGALMLSSDKTFPPQP